MPNIPRHNIRRITVRAPIQEAGCHIWIVNKHSTMKFYWNFDQGFTAQTMPCIHRSNWCFIGLIPNFCGISTGVTFILESSTQFEPPDYELNVEEGSWCRGNIN
jgi:hypothetical protein